MNHRPLVLVSRPYPNDETLNGLGITSFCQRYSGGARDNVGCRYNSTREFREGAGEGLQPGRVGRLDDN